jgi:hypothetical protein
LKHWLNCSRQQKWKESVLATSKKLVSILENRITTKVSGLACNQQYVGIEGIYQKNFALHLFDRDNPGN